MLAHGMHQRLLYTIRPTGFLQVRSGVAVRDVDWRTDSNAPMWLRCTKSIFCGRDALTQDGQSTFAELALSQHAGIRECLYQFQWLQPIKGRSRNAPCCRVVARSVSGAPQYHLGLSTMRPGWHAATPYSFPVPSRGGARPETGRCPCICMHGPRR